MTQTPLPGPRRPAAVVSTSALLVAALAACTGGSDGTGSSTGDDPTTSSTTATSTMTSSTTATSTMTTTDPATSTTMPLDTGSDGPSTVADTSSSASTTRGDTSGTESSETGVGDCVPLIAEVFYDADAPSDEALQWVKLYNPCNVDIDLSTWSLGYARGELGDLELYLAGTKGFLAPPTFAAGECFVIGGDTSEPLNGDPDYDYPEDFAPSLFFPESAGAGIALFDVAVIDALSVPRDALVYGANNDNALIDETGTPVAAPHIDGSPVGGSMRRTGLAATWEAAAVPTPNECPAF